MRYLLGCLSVLAEFSSQMMNSILALSCLLVLPLPGVLGNDPQCRHCCNLESTLVDSTLKLAQCGRGRICLGNNGQENWYIKTFTFFSDGIFIIYVKL